MCPLRPHLVLNSMGLNQRMSSRLKNMNLITADFLLILKGCPDKITLLITSLSGSMESTLPVAITSCVPFGFSLKANTEAGGNKIGAKTVATITELG